MNCHEIEAMAGDLASGRLMDAAQREKAIAHSASCAACSARLSDERALTDGLRVIGRAANEDAPARIEAALLNSFREQRATLPAVGRAGIAGRRWDYVAASVAAVVLIVALLSLVAFRARISQESAPQKAASPTPAVPDVPRMSPPPRDSVSSEKVAIERPRPNDRAKKRMKVRATPPLEDLNRSAEIATDFIPLMNRETFDEMDGGQVMRVELPRSALMSFGLPMDMERATEPIKADVVVGNDGLARAIRFVR